MSDICRNCEGLGKEKCWNCEGAGRTWKEIKNEMGWEKCPPLCGGEGFNSCLNCDGTGRV